MTAGTGAALSHVLFPLGPDACCAPIRRRKMPVLTDRAAGRRFAENARRPFVPPPYAWPHEPCAGNAGLGWPFHGPHYLAKTRPPRR